MKNLPQKPDALEKQYKSPMRFYRFAVHVLRALFVPLFRLRVVGAENVPKDGACFVCANHISDWDALFVAVAVRRPIHFMAKKQLFHIPVLKSIVKAFGAFSVDRDSADVGAVKTALYYCKYGEQVGIFPQGHRFDGVHPATTPIKSGLGMLIYRTQSPVLPVSVYTKDFKVRIFKKVTVTVGKPVQFDEYGVTEKGQEQYQLISDDVFRRVCSQIDETAALSAPKEKGSAS